MKKPEFAMLKPHTTSSTTAIAASTTSFSFCLT